MAGEEKQTLNPKEIIHDKFGVKASYRIEEVHASSNGCLYRCHLQLPDFTVVSNVFKEKKDSEQSAAELALEKLGIHPLDYNDDDITVEEAWDDIVERIKYIFSDEFLSADHPLGGHFRAALQRDGELCGSVPVSVIATFDTKINSRCKVINPSVASDPSLFMSYVMKAAAKLPDYIVVSPHEDSLRRKKPYPSAIIKALATQVESIKVEAVHLQCSVDGEEAVKPVTLDISSGRYYLDIIAEKLGLKDGSQVMISRTIGKTASGLECRVYAAIPKLKFSDTSWKSREKRPINESSHLEKSRNAKASFVSGLDIHGDAIVASVGYPWGSHNLEHDDVTLKSFFRICCGMSPNGIYKLSRQAIIAAQLPFSFTTKSNWRGPFPSEILGMFCRQQQLAEPIFTISTAPVKPLSSILRSYQKLKDSVCDDSDNQSTGKEEILESGTGYRCQVKILSKSQDLVLDCSLTKFYEKENYAIQNASLNALSWFSKLFEEGDVDPLQICYTDEHLDMIFQQRVLMKETIPRGHFRNRDELDITEDQTLIKSITNGSLVTICYSVYLDVDAEFSRDDKSKKELIESNEEIEFAIGNGSMNPHLESVVTQLSVGQYARFLTDAPADDLFVTAATGTVRDRSLLSDIAGLEYRVRLLGVKGPPEKQIEADFFKPPLSKRRLEYTVKHIEESSASTLVDFGCGSGSLLASLLDYPTSLQTIAGVDISQKGLARAAKMLHLKLNKGACNIKSTTLYDGSMLEFDSRLHDIDIGTCLEVIEHMEEDEAREFGKTVLSLFRPKLLIVSTPNYEYNNKILQKATLDPSKNKFRNEKHKFEWTRKQFKQWASKLANRHNYNVQFSGVGGTDKPDPGFASQIAVFRRKSLSVEVNLVGKDSEGSMRPYKVAWEWTRGNGDKKTNL